MPGKELQMDDNEIAGELRKWADVLQYNHRGFNPQWQSMYNAADLIESLQSQLAEAERRERAAVEDLKANWLCRACSKREKGREWCGCKHGDFVMDDERVVRCSHFEWRGPQEGATDEV
jgi:hypothetical protein